MFILDYIYWHYRVAPKEILVLLVNFLTAIWHKFFIKQHLMTLLSPWHRLHARDVIASKSIVDKLGNFLVDIYTRLLAALIRLTIIIMGLTAGMAVLIFFITLFIAWLLWPVIFIAAIGKGWLLVI